MYQKQMLLKTLNFQKIITIHQAHHIGKINNFAFNAQRNERPIYFLSRSGS